MDDVTIRALQVEDAEAITSLCASLGYTATVDEIRSRLETFAGSRERIALGAIRQDTVVGWIDGAVERHLQTKPCVTIGGLVVRDDLRGKRIGQRLCQAIEDWTSRIGLGTIRVRSQTKRTAAHRFYLREGYEQVKVSAVFEKRLGDSPDEVSA